MSKVSAWLRTHPLTALFLGIVAFAAGAHLFANWRAEVRWQRYCTEARARGVKLTLAEFAPPEIPDAENFAALPMMRAAFARSAPAAFKLPRPNGAQPPIYNYAKGERIDFAAWAKFFQDAGYISATTGSPPRDVLRALEHYAPQFQEWSEWRMRPHCRFPIQLDAGGMLKAPDFQIFSNAFQIFTLRMQAHLAAGDSAAAVTDFEDALQSYRALEGGSGLVTAVLRMGVLAMLCSQLGESLVQPVWTDLDLHHLQMDLAAVNVWKNFRQAFSGERVSGNSLYDRLAQSPAERKALSTLIVGPSATAWKETACMLIPSRVFRENQLLQNQHLDEHLARISADELHFDPDREIISDPDKLNGFLDEYYFHLFKLCGGAFSIVGEQSVSLQTRLEQTRLAVALERFRLARGSFPETLAELAPEFISAVPVETYSRRPMIYRRKEGGTFVLYGVGKNRRDDGGAADVKDSDGNKLDNVWLYAPPAR